MSALEKLILSNDDNEILVQNVKALMQTRNLNEAELARQSNIPQPTLHRLMAGNTFDPRISTLRQLANYFHVTLDELYSYGSKKTLASYPLDKVRFIPIIQWYDCKPNILKSINLSGYNGDNYIAVQTAPPEAFALISKPSMEPQFPRNTLLLISPKLTPTDGDFVIVYFEGTEEATLRGLSLDGPYKRLISLGHSKSDEKFDAKVTIIGTLVESRFIFHK